VFTHNKAYLASQSVRYLKQVMALQKVLV
jgi:hypothetical protein